jgi:hypothetical protein
MQIEENRIRLLMDAVYELDKMARILPGLVPLDEGQDHYAVRCIAGRMLRLTHVLMGGLDDGQITDERMLAILSLEGSGQG